MEATGSADPLPYTPTINPLSGTPFQTLPRMDNHSEAARRTADVPTFGTPPGLPRTTAARAQATPAPGVAQAQAAPSPRAAQAQATPAPFQDAPSSHPAPVSFGETPLTTGQTSLAPPTNLTPGGVPQYVKATEAASVSIPAIPH